MRAFILFSFLFIFSCATNKHIIIDDTPFFTMKRTACYGTCPQYMVSIFNDGRMTYNGNMFVKMIGCFNCTIDYNQIKSIKLLLAEMSFFDLDSVYMSPVTDIPSVITEFIIDNNTSHRVVDRLSGPNDLKKLYKKIDLIIDSINEWDLCE